MSENPVSEDPGTSRPASRKETFVFTPADGVPPQVGPFAHATRLGDLVLVTGQMPTDPATGELVAGGIQEQAEQVRANLAAVPRPARPHPRRRPAGAGLPAAASTSTSRCSTSSYRTWFDGPLPARTTIGVTGLAVGALVEVDVTAGR